MSNLTAILTPSPSLSGSTINEYNHNLLANRDSDGHSQYALLAGRLGDSFDMDGDEFLAFRDDGNIGDGKQYLFFDFSTWSAANGGAVIQDANNFHYADSGLLRAEFESLDNEMQFYIEGGSGYDAWYGLQEGATHHWSFGQDSSSGGAIRFCPSFGLTNEDSVMMITKTGSVGIGNTTIPLARLHVKLQALTNIHQSLAAHKTVLVEDSGDGVFQMASDNLGSVGCGFVLTNMEGAGDGRHWVLQHRGTTVNNNFEIGYYNSSADGENLMTGATPYFTVKTNGRINMSSLPTSASGLASGDLWNNSGVINIV